MKRVYRTEYFDDRICKWVSFYESADLKRAKSFLNTPIAGDPPLRVAAYDRSGVRKIKYSFVGVIETFNPPTAA